MSAAHWPDESDTKPIEPVPTRTLVIASRIDRLAEVASERLTVGPDADAIVAAIADLAVIRALAAELLP